VIVALTGAVGVMGQEGTGRTTVLKVVGLDFRAGQAAR